MNVILWGLIFLLGGTFIPLIALALYFKYLPLRLRDMRLLKDSPQVSVIVPCRGLDTKLRENLTSILQQIYPVYEVIFVTSSPHDSSFPVLEELSEAYPNRAKLVIAAPSDCRSDKINNQLAAIKQMNKGSQVIVFYDSDGYARPEFLSRLVAPLYEEGITATTGYRWFAPEKFGMLNAIVVMWGGLSLALQSNPAFTIVWGGAMAIKRDVFERLRVEEEWKGALCDDNVLALLLRRAHLKTIFVPLAIVLNQPPFDWRSFIRWGRRQFFLLRITLFRDWLLILLLLSIVTFGPMVALTLFGLITDAWVSICLTLIGVLGTLASLWGIVFYLAVVGGENITCKSGHPVVDMPRKYFALAVILPFMMAIQVIGSAVGRSIAWRGIVYEAVAYNKTQVLKSDSKYSSQD